MYNNISDVSRDCDFYKEESRFELGDVNFGCDNLRDLICNQFGLSDEVYIRLVECGMDMESLSLLKEDDIKELFPINMMGNRIKFRSRITRWQQSGLQTQKKSSTANKISQMLPSPPVGHFDRQSLYMILNSISKGQIILKFYEENSKLSDEHRVALISIIVDQYKDRSMAMSMSDIVRYTEEIGVLFPSEEKKYYYSTRGKGLNPIGKLYDKAINARRKIRKRDVEVTKVVEVAKNDVELVPSKDELKKKTWLSCNEEPWDEVLEKWQLTSKIRRADILKGENILLDWPLFKNSLGYMLVDIDFAELYPENAISIFNEWLYFKEDIIPYLKEKIKDHDSKELFEKLKGDISADSTDCIIVLLLHAVIKPPLLSTKLISNDGANKRRKWKPTISDAQNATIIHCTVLNDYKSKYDQLKPKSCQKTKMFQPILLVVGEDLTKLKDFYVLFDTILYKLPTFIKALDCLFKLYCVMNFEYRLAARYLYELIESYFFKIRISSNPNIISLTNYLNDCKRSSVIALD